MPAIFKDTLKLYYFREKDLVSLNILTAPTHVLTFYMSASVFEALISPAAGKEGILHEPYFVMRKREYVRFTIDTQNMTHNLRIETSKWDQLIADYHRRRDSSAEGVIACVVP